MATSDNTSKLRVARPAVVLAGQEEPSLTLGLLRLCVIETTVGLCRCEAAFGNWGKVGNSVDFLYFDRKKLDFGKSIQVKLGQSPVFDGRITGLEAQFPEGAAPEIVVLAEDLLQDFRMVRRTRSFFDVTDADIVRSIAAEHGLSAAVDAPGPKHKQLAQLNQSDLAFIRERVRAVDAEIWIDGKTLHAQARAARRGSPVVLGYRNELREFTVLADLAQQRSALTVSGWDVAAKQAIAFRASDDAVRGELSEGSSGASILAKAFGVRRESMVHSAPANQAEAQARAEALFRQNARRFLRGHGVAEASERLRVGATVTLQGLGDLFSGKYYLSEVVMRFDGVKGIRTEFVAERPALGPA